jgi:glycine dehydrogenase subunit 1
VLEGGLRPVFSGPFFNEFVVKVERLAERLPLFNAGRIAPGIPLARWYPELPNSLLVCATEMTTREEIDDLVGTFSRG